jgi:hypothetical protein
MALVVLLLGATAGHVHPHGQKLDCTLCHATPEPELLDAVSLLEAPARAELEPCPPLADVNLTLVEVDSSISFRGPPA